MKCKHNLILMKYMNSLYFQLVLRTNVPIYFIPNENQFQNIINKLF